MTDHAPQACDLIIEAGWVVPVVPHGVVLADHAVVVSGGAIVAVLPIAVQPPNFVELKITETDPGVKGDTAGTGGKPATLETGAVVRVPLFVGQDEKIKVNTKTGEYESRVK